jgi:hypothetical protein
VYVTPDETFAFIAHPRTASRATKQSLGLPFFERTGHHELDRDVCERVRNNAGMVACTIRNPYDVVVSWFHNEHFREDGQHKPGQFIPWVARTGLDHTQWLKRTPYFYGLRFCNHVLRFEQLEEDLKEVCDMMDLKYTPTKPYGVLPRDRDYRGFYDDETREFVATKFAADFAATGYTF